MTSTDENNTTEGTTEGQTTAEGQTTEQQAATPPRVTKREVVSLEHALSVLNSGAIRSDLPRFNTGDTVRVHAKIVEGNKERVQVFEGVVIKRVKGELADASFTVRKVSYNVGVERTFLLHSPRIDKIEIVSRAKVRRSRLFYLRPLRGKATRMKTLFENTSAKDVNPTQAA